MKIGNGIHQSGNYQTERCGRGREGCLSLPGINANVKRSKTIHVNAYDYLGKEVDMEVSGFLARSSNTK